MDEPNLTVDLTLSVLPRLQKSNALIADPILA
jgi:hypothetical protein